MALKPGFENKRQLYLLLALGAIIVVAGGYEIYDNFFSSPTTARPVPVATPNPVPANQDSSQNFPQPSTQTSAQPANASAANATGPAAEKVGSISNAGLDPTLHVDKLLLAEQVQYAGSGRNIFSAESAPIVIPKPVIGPRPGGKDSQANLPPQPPPKPQPPAIDLKYFGYAQSRDKSLKAFFVHGDDIFMARSGDIVDHRYKVGTIMPGSVQITDLSFNNTQSIPFTAN
jgi:hypothetical protein